MQKYIYKKYIFRIRRITFKWATAQTPSYNAKRQEKALILPT